MKLQTNALNHRVCW